MPKQSNKCKQTKIVTFLFDNLREILDIRVFILNKVLLSVLFKTVLNDNNYLATSESSLPRYVPRTYFLF